MNGGLTLYRDPSLDLDMDLSTITMDTLFATMPSNTIMVAGVDSGWNKDIAPASTGTLIAVSRYQGRKFAIFNTAGLSDLWIGSMGSSFSGWKPFATAEPPQEYSLPDVDGTITYSKDQFGRVYLYIHITATTISNEKLLGTLPVGYRPSSQVTALARVGGTFATVDITTTGSIRIFNAEGATSTGVIFASASFLAA